MNAANPSTRRGQQQGQQAQVQRGQQVQQQGQQVQAVAAVQQGQQAQQQGQQARRRQQWGGQQAQNERALVVVSEEVRQNGRQVNVRVQQRIF